jgi:O-glycosyl hydrolase
MRSSLGVVLFCLVAHPLVFGFGNDADNGISRSVPGNRAQGRQPEAAGIVTTTEDPEPANNPGNTVAADSPSESISPLARYVISGNIRPSYFGAGTSVLLTGRFPRTTTADTNGNYRFFVAASGTYIVKPSKPGFFFNPESATVQVTGSGVTGINFTAGVNFTPNLTVDFSKPLQAIAGMGVNINVNSWNGGRLKPALDALIDTNGSSAFRVIRDPMTWVTRESLIPALHNLDPATLQQVYETPAMQDIWNTIGYLNQKGIAGNQITLNFMGWTPTWLGGSGSYGNASYITFGKEPAFATMVASLVYYGRKVKNLSFTYLSPLNESDWNCLEGPCVQPSQYLTIMKALATELDAMGLADVRFILPDTASSPNSYISTIRDDSQVFGRTDHLTYHMYGGTVSAGQSYPGKDYWATETAASCSSCDTAGTPSQGEWEFASQTNDILLDDLGNGISAALVYDGYDSFYYHHNSLGYWGLLEYDQGAGTYTPRKRFYVNTQLNRFIRPGTRLYSVTTSAPGLDHIDAFLHPTTGKVAIVGHNSGGAPVTLKGQLLNLPVGLSSLNLYQTNATVDFQQGPAIPLRNGGFVVTIPPDTFFSLGN